MDGEATKELPSALSGYDRAAVEVFFERAAVRRAQLESVIANATERRERAASAQARNRALAQDAQRELAAIRADAEARAAQIVVAARLEAQVLLRAAREQAGSANDAGSFIDLRDSDSRRSANGTNDHGDELSYATLASAARAESTYDEAAASDYFEYLRGALPIDAPGAE